MATSKNSQADPRDPYRDAVLTGVKEQIDAQKAAGTMRVELALLLVALNELDASLTAAQMPTSMNGTAQRLVKLAGDVQGGTKEFASLAQCLVDLYELRHDVALELSKAAPPQRDPATTVALDSALLQCITACRKLLGTRPDVTAVMEDLSSIKNLRGGPADATAFHDFHTLKLAFKSVWLHAFDGQLKSAVEQLYDTVAGPDASSSATPVELPPNLSDINELKALLARLRAGLDSVPPDEDTPFAVALVFGDFASSWSFLSTEQKTVVFSLATQDLAPGNNAIHDELLAKGRAILGSPQGFTNRLTKLMFEISKALTEPYHFDVFAPGTYNFGLLVTHRQEWTPGPYQAGDLVATIPLAPGETRRFTKRRVIKETRATKEAKKSSQDTSTSSTTVGRAESEIMKRTLAASNFKLTLNASVNLGIASVGATSELGVNAQLFDSQTTKSFQEATLKAAEDYRQEHSMEVDTTSSIESEETTAGEISNPNTEITCTYLFYELQRRYQVHQYLYRVVPVILVAQDVPEPQEIDEAWLIAYQWIIARVLLDESFRPSLAYLASGFAGDETSTSVLEASWVAQQKLVSKLEALVSDQTIMRDSLRETLVQTALKKAETEQFEMSTAAKILSFGLAVDPAEKEAALLAAHADAAKTRLGYVEQALADAQRKLTDASAAFHQATQDYAKALREKFTRHIAIDQLRVHVKQNIIFYMQAIYSHEPTDQRFFRLYNKQVLCPDKAPGCIPTVVAAAPYVSVGRPPPTVKMVNRKAGGPLWDVMFSRICVPTMNAVGGMQHDLCEVADLDNPLGHKGNYIMFPFIDTCPLVDYMLSNYVDTEIGVMDEDLDLRGFNPATFEERLAQAVAAGDVAAEHQLKDQLRRYITAVRRSTEDIIVPTGQLFIEALPGTHPLLEDFKLEHRLVDVMKARGEARRDELENLRFASRLVEGQTTPALLGDPHVDKQVMVVGAQGAVMVPPG